MGDAGGAVAEWTKGLAQLPVNIPERPAEIYERTELLKRLGRTAEARSLESRLAEIGFKGVS